MCTNLKFSPFEMEHANIVKQLYRYFLIPSFKQITSLKKAADFSNKPSFYNTIY